MYRLVLWLGALCVSFGVCFWVRAADEAGAEKPAPQRGSFQLSLDGVDTKLYRTIFERHDGPNRIPAFREQLAALKRRRAPRSHRPGHEGQPVVFDVHVPESWDGVAPLGVFAYINTVQQAGTLKDWKPVLEERNLVWLYQPGAGAEDARFQGAAIIDAMNRLAQTYPVDTERRYVGGFSGGGMFSSSLVLHMPEHLSGGVYMAGIMTIGSDLKPKLLRTAGSRCRHVYFTGADDKLGQGWVRTDIPKYQKHCKYFTVVTEPKLDHKPPSAEPLRRCFAALDAPLAEAAEASFKQGEAHEKAGRLSQALEAYHEAAAHGFGAAFAQTAKQRVEALQAGYRHDLEKAEKLIADGDRAGVNRLLADLRRRWGAAAASDIAELRRKMAGN